MRVIFLSALIAAATLASSVSAQTLPGDYQGTVPWQFRDANDRVARLATAQTQEAVRRGLVSGGAAGSGGFAGTPFGSSTTIGNYNQVQVINNCYSTGAGSPVTCSGTASSAGTTQSNNGSTLTSDTNVSDNNIRTRNVTNNNGGDQ